MFYGYLLTGVLSSLPNTLLELEYAYSEIDVILAKKKIALIRT